MRPRLPRHAGAATKAGTSLYREGGEAFVGSKERAAAGCVRGGLSNARGCRQIAARALTPSREWPQGARGRDAVSGICCQIGFNTRRTTGRSISATGSLPTTGKTYCSSDWRHCAQEAADQPASWAAMYSCAHSSNVRLRAREGFRLRASPACPQRIDPIQEHAPERASLGARVRQADKRTRPEAHVVGAAEALEAEDPASRVPLEICRETPSPTA